MMLATYPDVFAASAPFAGVSSKCDLACSQALEVKTQQEWGDKVRAAGPAGYTGAGQVRKVYKNAGDVAKVETVMITGMGHGTAIDPGSATQQCGTAAAYILDVNLCSSYYIFKWFGLDQ